MSLRATGATRKGLGGGATRGLHGGPSQRTGPRGAGTTKRFTTRSGGTTSASQNEQDKDMKYNEHLKEWVNAKPKPLIKMPEELKPKIHET